MKAVQPRRTVLRRWRDAGGRRVVSRIPKKEEQHTLASRFLHEISEWQPPRFRRKPPPPVSCRGNSTSRKRAWP